MTRVFETLLSELRYVNDLLVRHQNKVWLFQISDRFLSLPLQISCVRIVSQTHFLLQVRVFFRQLLRDARCEQNIESPMDHDVVLSKQRSIVVVSFEVVLVETEEGLAGLQAIYLGELILFGWVELNIVSFITPVHSNLLLLHLVVFKSFEDQPVEFYLAEVVFGFVREVVFHVESECEFWQAEGVLGC